MFYVWMDVDAIICLLCVQMWDLAGGRLSWSECRLVRGPVRPPWGGATGRGEMTVG
jgi:hypothetical protein